MGALVFSQCKVCGVAENGNPANIQRDGYCFSHHPTKGFKGDVDSIVKEFTNLQTREGFMTKKKTEDVQPELERVAEQVWKEPFAIKIDPGEAVDIGTHVITNTSEQAMYLREAEPSSLAHEEPSTAPADYGTSDHPMTKAEHEDLRADQAVAPAALSPEHDADAYLRFAKEKLEGIGHFETNQAIGCIDKALEWLKTAEETDEP